MSANQPDSVTVLEAYRLAGAGATLLDLRTAAERVVGMPDGAEAVHPEDLQGWLQHHDGSADVLLICARGLRSAQAAAANRDYGPVISIEGGFQAWHDAGLPITGQAIDSAEQSERYQKHLLLDEIGVAGQKKLLESRVLIVGAGGLGSPAALYLAAAGVGSLGLVDDDRVERSNLQRQILHSEDRLGELKTQSAVATLSALNPDVELQLFKQRLDADSVQELLTGWDIVIDAVDNFPSRYTLMDAAAQMRIPVVYGAVDRFSGQLGVFAPWQSDEAPCYRCLFPKAPEGALNCSEAGVLGAVPGVIGTLQATETIKWLLQIGEPLAGQILIYDALDATSRKVRVLKDPACEGVGH